jgi:hypothetical protein
MKLYAYRTRRFKRNLSILNLPGFGNLEGLYDSKTRLGEFYIGTIKIALFS